MEHRKLDKDTFRALWASFEQQIGAMGPRKGRPKPALQVLSTGFEWLPNWANRSHLTGGTQF